MSVVVGLLVAIWFLLFLIYWNVVDIKYDLRKRGRNERHSTDR